MYEMLRAGTTVHNSDSGSEVARKINSNFKNLKDILDGMDDTISEAVEQKISEAVDEKIVPEVEQKVAQAIADGDIPVSVPAATQDALGTVRSSEDENGVRVKEDGTQEVVSVNVNKLVQDEGDILVFDGNNS